MESSESPLLPTCLMSGLKAGAGVSGVSICYRVSLPWRAELHTMMHVLRGSQESVSSFLTQPLKSHSITSAEYYSLRERKTHPGARSSSESLGGCTRF